MTNASMLIDGVKLTEVAGEPRVRDVDLAVRLGFERPRDVRKLIERNMDILADFGTCATVARVIRGNPTAEYWLNRQQAIWLCTASGTPTGRKFAVNVVKVFDAFVRGELVAATYKPGTCPLYDTMLAEAQQPWELMFPDSLVSALCKLDRQPWAGGAHPAYLKSTNDKIYGLLLGSDTYAELKRRKRAAELDGRHHQLLSDAARTSFKRHLGIVEALANQSRGKADFWARMDRQYGKQMLQLEMAG